MDGVNAIPGLGPGFALNRAKTSVVIPGLGQVWLCTELGPGVVMRLARASIDIPGLGPGLVIRWARTSIGVPGLGQVGLYSGLVP